MQGPRTSKYILAGLGAAGLVSWATMVQAEGTSPSTATTSGASVADGLSDGVAAGPAPAPIAANPPSPSPESSIVDAINGGKPIVEFRPRFENVDQANLLPAADAYTVRMHIGWETAAWRNLTGLVEYEVVQHVGTEHFNTTLNGKTQYPGVSDPDTAELNRAQLTWKPISQVQAVVGRQRILIDDQRFVGGANWRQDEQTFDAAKLDLTFGRLKATYIYLEKVNRVFAEAADWKSDSHLFNASYTLAEPLRIEGFVYALDFKQSPANSSLTYGGRFGGSTWVSLFKVGYDATYAHQTDYRNSPTHFALDFWEGDVAGTFDIYTAKLVYESLQGDGHKGFATPLTTLHPFGGWADVFLTTPAVGLRNLNESLSIKPRFKATYFFNPEFQVRHHNFWAEKTGASLGSEWDFQLTGNITANLTGLVKLADYLGPSPTLAPYFSRRKVWVGFEFKL